MSQRKTQSFLRSWSRLKKKFQAASRIFLFFDFDGTLAPIVARPGLAKLSIPNRRRLKKLHNRKHITLGFVSGRGLADVQRRVQIKNAIYAGNHGFDIHDGKQRFQHPGIRAAGPWLKRCAVECHRALNPFPGNIVEDKGTTLSIHYRLIPKQMTTTFMTQCLRLLNPYQKKYYCRITYGKKVIEVRPNIKWDKGKAIEKILTNHQFVARHDICFYIGDDRTDEDAFGVINRHKGVSVRVGSREQKTIAHYFLRSSRDIEKVLDRFLGV